MKHTALLLFALVSAPAYSQALTLGVETAGVRAKLKTDYSTLGFSGTLEDRISKNNKTGLVGEVSVADRVSIEASLSYADLGDENSKFLETALRLTPKYTFYYLGDSTESKGESLFVIGGLEAKQISLKLADYNDLSGVIGLGMKHTSQSGFGFNLSARQTKTIQSENFTILAEAGNKVKYKNNELSSLEYVVGLSLKL